MNMLLTLNIFNFKTLMPVNLSPADLSKYISISLKSTLQSSQYTKGALIKQVSPRRCTNQDFADIGGEQVQQSFYGEMHANTGIMCFDVGELSLLSNTMFPPYKDVRLEIFFCSGNGCKSEQEIREFLADLIIDVNVVQERIDMHNFKGKPVRMDYLKLGWWRLDLYNYSVYEVFVNKMKTNDHYFQLGIEDTEWKSLQIDKSNSLIIQQPYRKNDQGTTQIVRMQWKLSDLCTHHERKIYSFLDAIGDYGGFAQVVEALVAFLLAPIAQHAFLTEAISSLFFAHTSDELYFSLNSISGRSKSHSTNSGGVKYEDNVRQITISARQSILGFMARFYCFRKSSKLRRLY